MLWTTSADAFPDTPSYAHKRHFMLRYRDAFPRMLFVDLIIVRGRSQKCTADDVSSRVPGVFEHMLGMAHNAAAVLGDGAVCTGLINPFNSYMIHVIQGQGYFLLLDISQMRMPYSLFTHQFDGHWIYSANECVSWVPVVRMASALNKARRTDSVRLELCDNVFLPQSLTHSHRWARMTFPVKRSKSLLTDRICGYLLSTTHFGRHTKCVRDVPLEQFNDMRTDNRLLTYNKISRGVQSAGYAELERTVSHFLADRSGQTVDILDLGAGCSDWASIKSDLVHVHLKDIPTDADSTRSPINVLGFNPNTDLMVPAGGESRDPDLLIMANFLARLFDYASKEGRDLTLAEKRCFLASVLHYVADKHSTAIIQESSISPEADVDLQAVSDWCTSRHPDLFSGKDQEVLLRFWSAYWWYALAEKVVQPLGITSIIGAVPFLNTSDMSIDKDRAGTLRVSHVYTLSSIRERVYDVFFYSLSTHQAESSDFVGGIVDRATFYGTDERGGLLHKASAIFGTTRLVDAMREYQTAHLGMSSSLSFVFVAFEGRCTSDVKTLVKALARFHDVVYVSNMNSNGTGKDSAVVSSRIDLHEGDSCYSACSFFDATHSYLAGQVNATMNGRPLLSITVGRYIRTFSGYATFSTNCAIERGASVDEGMLISAIHEQCDELDNKVEAKVRESLRRESTRAASAAIMSRNMAHHIGSHVIPRATVKDVERRLAELYMVPDQPPHKAVEVFPGVERLKTTLDDFIQKKADFLAEVTTDPCSSSDARLLGRDVLAPLMRNALLMDNIARNEGYGYELIAKEELSPEELKQLRKQADMKSRRQMEVEARMRSTLKLSLCVRANGECRRILGPDLPPYDPTFWPLDSRKREPSLFGVDPNCADLDPMIAVPGMVGQFALYGILENVIRNAAKHDKGKKTSRSLHIHLHVEDDPEAPDEYCRLSIWDDRANPANESKFEHIPGDPKGEKRERSLDEHLQCWADADLIDPAGAVRREAWGIAEIVICANLLAGRSRYDNTIRIGDEERKVVRIFRGPSPHIEGKALACNGHHVSQEECQGQRLIHQFRVLKAKRAAFVGRAFANAWGGQVDSALRKKGVYAFADLDELRLFLRRREGRLAFQFVVFDGDSVSATVLDCTNEANTDFLAKLPFRLLWVTATGTEPAGVSGTSGVVSLPLDRLADLIAAPTADALMERLWQDWIVFNQRLNPERKTVTSLVYLDIESSDPTFMKWSCAADAFNRKDGPVKLSPQCSGSERIGDGNPSEKTIRAAFVRHKDTLGALAPGDMFESFGKRSADCDALLGAVLPSKDHLYWELPYMLAEAGLVRILVIDERMTERALTPFDGDSRVRERLRGSSSKLPCFWHLAQRAKVYIATHLQVGNRADSMRPLHKSYDIAHQNRQESTSAEGRVSCPALKLKITASGGLETVLSDPNGTGCQDDAPEFDIVVIHQGVIDSFRPRNEKHECEITEETMRRWIAKTHPWLVVESGRGIPPGLQKQPIRFLSFSVLDQAMTADGIGKLYLTRRLMALPRFVDDGDKS